MNYFTDAESEYLTKGLLGRLATVGPDGVPHVTPLGVFLDPQDQTLVIGGHVGTGFAASKKYRDARHHPEVAVVVDDLASVDPWQPRYIEVRGRAETYVSGGEEVGERLSASFPFDAAWMRIHPSRVLAFNLDGTFELAARDIAAP